MKQHTLSKIYSFEGKGLHTGLYAHMQICPAPVDTGVRFIRTDLHKIHGHEAYADAVAENVSKTARSTTITGSGVSVSTVEHLLSALTGLGIDNAYVRIDNREVPILDGSARPYVEAISKDGTVEQDAERKWIEINHVVEYKNPKTGSWIRLEPADSFSVESTIDFNSKVLGVQTVRWDDTVDYATQIAPCRTFCFLHEVFGMLMAGLVKGGDLGNAIVIVERPVSRLKMRLIARRLRQPNITVTERGYLSNIALSFPDECGRHKLLDLMGDLRLCGGFLKAKVTAYKPGHSLNTKVAQMIK
ncbi:MAG: UDP-3-O-acyl-N-acetylglucosamine deacetylase [Bacteroidales bacterium]|nr:UDP-3-O-acyl-N-acetylglucosamine deacetylase [Bacteroidales bacterium]